MKKTACALGFFDGVHEAHSHILKTCVKYAKEHNLKSVALTFEKSPAEYFGKKIKYLTSPSQKEELMKELGIDEVVVLPCNEKTLSLSHDEFADSILIDLLNAEAVFCGFNYTFGKNAQGNATSLKLMGEKKGFLTFVIPQMLSGGVTVSSSEIRLALSNGNLRVAMDLLNRPFELRGTVCEGKKLGRTLNFPTANIYPDNLPDLPHGVYATKTVADGREYLSVTNVGVNPTVGDGNLRIETYIIGFSGEIYQKEISVRFYSFLRKEEKFDSIEILKNQIEADTEAVISYFKRDI